MYFSLFRLTTADTNSASSSTRQEASSSNNQSPSQDRLRQQTSSSQRTQNKNSNLYNYYHDQQPITNYQPNQFSNKRLSQPLTTNENINGNNSTPNLHHPNSAVTSNLNNNCDTPGKSIFLLKLNFQKFKSYQFKYLIIYLNL